MLKELLTCILTKQTFFTNKMNISILFQIKTRTSECFNSTETPHLCICTFYCCPVFTSPLSKSYIVNIVSYSQCLFDLITYFLISFPVMGSFFFFLQFAVVELPICVRLFVTPWTITLQAAMSIGFSRQECWNGLPFPSLGDLPNPGIEPLSPTFTGSFLSLFIRISFDEGLLVKLLIFFNLNFFCYFSHTRSLLWCVDSSLRCTGFL